MATNDNHGGTPPELNPKLTKPGENDAATDALAAEAKATNDNGGTVSQREVSQPPSVDPMVLDLKQKIAEAAENKSLDATAEGSAEENKSSDATAKGSVEENKSPDATAEGLVEPAMVSLPALSAMLPSPGPKVYEYQPAT
jgi:hypothetical protein